MPRYALIDRYSGYVWGVEDAPDPATAAIQCQIETEGDRGWVATDMSLSHQLDNGYDVHPVPEGWDCDDGQNEDEIAEATVLPAVAVILVEEADEE